MSAIEIARSAAAPSTTAAMNNVMLRLLLWFGIRIVRQDRMLAAKPGNKKGRNGMTRSGPF